MHIINCTATTLATSSLSTCVGARGLEPPILSEYDSESYAYTSSATHPIRSCYDEQYDLANACHWRAPPVRRVSNSFQVLAQRCLPFSYQRVCLSYRHDRNGSALPSYINRKIFRARNKISRPGTRHRRTYKHRERSNHQSLPAWRSAVCVHFSVLSAPHRVCACRKHSYSARTPELVPNYWHYSCSVRHSADRVLQALKFFGTTRVSGSLPSQ